MKDEIIKLGEGTVLNQNGHELNPSMETKRFIGTLRELLQEVTNSKLQKVTITLK